MAMMLRGHTGLGGVVCQELVQLACRIKRRKIVETPRTIAVR